MIFVDFGFVVGGLLRLVGGRIKYWCVFVLLLFLFFRVMLLSGRESFEDVSFFGVLFSRYTCSVLCVGFESFEIRFCVFL